MKIFLEQDKSTEGAKAAFAALELGRNTASDVLAMSDEFYLPEAKVVYARSSRWAAKRSCLISGLGNIALHSGDLTEAEKWFIQARELASGTSRGAAGMGPTDRCRAQQNDDQRDKKSSRRRARCWKSREAKGEDSATVYSELGAVYYKLAMWEKAAGVLRAGAAHAAAAQRFALSLGQSYAQLGRIKEAEQKYREILALSPDDAEALKALQELGKRYLTSSAVAT